MLTRRSDTSARFTRQDVPRVAIAAGILILAMTAVLGADILPEAPLDATVGQLATRDVVAPRAVDFVSESQTEAARLAAMNDGPAAVHVHLRECDPRSQPTSRSRSRTRVSPIDTTFSADLSDEGRASLLKTAVPDLTPTARDTLVGLDVARLGRGQDRGCAGPGRDPAHAVARLGGRGATQSAGRADGGGPRRGGADARRGTHQSVGRPELHRSAPS